MEDQKTFGFIGRCLAKGCKCVIRVDVASREHTSYRRTGQSYKSLAPCVNELPYLECIEHKRRVNWRMIEGTVSEAHVCDSRCRYAKNQKCLCSCGGKNHGMGHCIG